MVKGARARNSGVTLAEILVVLVIGASAFVMIASAYRQLMERQVRLKIRDRALHTAVSALDRFRADIARSRVILEAYPGRVRLWTLDQDFDGIADEDEIVTYSRDGAVSPDEGDAYWIRSDSRAASPLLRLRQIRVGVDLPPPETRHLVVQISSNAGGETVSAGIGAALRRPSSEY